MASILRSHYGEERPKVTLKNDLKIMIGIIVHAHHFIEATELILAPLKRDPKDLKKEDCWKKVLKA